MENLESSKKSEIETEINLDELAIQYAEKLRLELTELKEKKADPHLERINPQELTYEDLMIFDRARKYNLKESEFKTYEEGLRQYFKEQKNIVKKVKADELRRKLKNNEISDQEFIGEFNKLLKEEDEKREKDGRGYTNIANDDSRANFAAMIRNKILEEKDIEKHIDNPSF